MPPMSINVLKIGQSINKSIKIVKQVRFLENPKTIQRRLAVQAFKRKTSEPLTA